MPQQHNGWNQPRSCATFAKLSKNESTNAILKILSSGGIVLEDNEYKDGYSEQEEAARLNARMGPFFTRALMKELLSLTDREVDRLIATQYLLAVITEDEIELFPA